MSRSISIILAGLLFGGGLVVSGLADPQRVLAFLRLGPGWDPSLAFTMAAALIITAPGFAYVRRRKPTSVATPRNGVDRRLIAGAAIFGLGWGWAGYCPGPALVGVGLVQWTAIAFVPAMLAGGWMARRIAG